MRIIRRIARLRHVQRGDEERMLGQLEYPRGAVGAGAADREALFLDPRPVRRVEPERAEEGLDRRGRRVDRSDAGARPEEDLSLAAGERERRCK